MDILCIYVRTYVHSTRAYVCTYIRLSIQYVPTCMCAASECVNVSPVVGFFALVCSYAPVIMFSLAEPDQCSLGKNV